MKFFDKTVKTFSDEFLLDICDKIKIKYTEIFV